MTESNRHHRLAHTMDARHPRALFPAPAPADSRPTIGVLALQGDVREHCLALEAAGAARTVVDCGRWDARALRAARGVGDALVLIGWGDAASALALALDLCRTPVPIPVLTLHRRARPDPGLREAAPGPCARYGRAGRVWRLVERTLDVAAR